MMMLLDGLGKIGTERSVGLPILEPLTQGETVSTGQINQVQGLTMLSLAVRPVQHQESGRTKSFFHAMQNDVLDGIKHIRFPTA